jgi:hypothetical protein
MLLPQLRVEPNRLGPCLENGKNWQNPNICRGYSSQEEQNMAATMKLGAHKKEKKTEIVCPENIFCRSKYDTHHLKQADRVIKKNDVCGLNLH